MLQGDQSVSGRHHGAGRSFSSNVLTIGETLDLKTVLAATNWNGSASTLANYLIMTDSASAARPAA